MLRSDLHRCDPEELLQEKGALVPYKIAGPAALKSVLGSRSTINKKEWKQARGLELRGSRIMLLEGWREKGERTRKKE